MTYVYIEDRWHKKTKLPDGGTRTERSARYGVGERWRVRYDAGAGERNLAFERAVDAKSARDRLKGDLLRGVFVDPAAGKMLFRQFGDAWFAARTFDHTTREQVASRLHTHVYPHLGHLQLAAIQPSTLQAWVAGLQGKRLATTTINLIFSLVSSMLGAAVDDGKIGVNPAKAPSIQKPTREQRKVEAWSTEWVRGVRGLLGPRYRTVLDAAVGAGMRQGEIFGLGTDEIQWTRRNIHVCRQVRIVGNQLVFALPKYKKIRDVPLAGAAGLAIAAHIEQFPPVKITLPWEHPGGKPTSAELIFTTRERNAINRNYFNSKIWKPALREAGIPAVRANMMHALRHWYASIQLHEGTDINALAEYLGHKDPGFTLRTYVHFMQQSNDRARRAIDKAFQELTGEAGRAPETAPDGPTGPTPAHMIMDGVPPQVRAAAVPLSG